MDKNSISGIVLIMAMLLGYQYFFAPKEPVQTNSEAVATKQVSPAAKSTKATALAVVADSSIQVKEQLYTLENENLRITLSNYGGKLV